MSYLCLLVLLVVLSGKKACVRRFHANKEFVAIVVAATTAVIRDEASLNLASQGCPVFNSCVM